MRIDERDRAREWFYHDVDAANDVKCDHLLDKLGLAGYGVFWRLVEDLYKAEGWELEYNPDEIAKRYKCTPTLIRGVVEKFQLFVVDGGKFWSDTIKRRAPIIEHRKKTKQKLAENAQKARDALKQTPVNHVENAVEASRPQVDKIMQDANETPRKTEQPPAMVIDSRELFRDENGTPETVVPAEELIRLWNANFEGTAQFHRGLFLSSAEHERARQTLFEGYTIDQIEQAFKIARTDDYGWRMMDVLKPSNIQMLLIKGERNAKAADKNKPGNDATPDLDEWYKLDERFSDNGDASDGGNTD